MNFIYPIKELLIYLAILFCPPDVNKITLEGIAGSERIELVRNGKDWQHEGNAVSIEGDLLVIHGASGKESVKISDFATSPRDHDWSRNPKFTLGDATTLRKTVSGFVIERNSPGGEANGTYEIHYPGAEAEPNAPSQIPINVLGEVNKPGVYQIRAGGSLLDALAAAGGAAVGGDLKHISIIRGDAGTIPKVTIHDLAAVLKGDGSNPGIQARDTIHVPALNTSEPKPTENPEIGVRAQAWLAAIDAGNFAQSWKEAAKFFQTSITEAAWSDALGKVRKPLGEMKSRKLLDAKSAKFLPGAPDGEYVVMQFETSFAAKEKAVETVTFIKESDGTWKAAGYFIR